MIRSLIIYVELEYEQCIILMSNNLVVCLCDTSLMGPGVPKK